MMQYKCDRCKQIIENSNLGVGRHLLQFYEAQYATRHWDLCDSCSVEVCEAISGVTPL